MLNAVVNVAMTDEIQDEIDAQDNALLARAYAEPDDPAGEVDAACAARIACGDDCDLSREVTMDLARHQAAQLPPEEDVEVLGQRVRFVGVQQDRRSSHVLWQYNDDDGTDSTFCVEPAKGETFEGQLLAHRKRWIRDGGRLRANLAALDGAAAALDADESERPVVMEAANQ